MRKVSQLVPNTQDTQDFEDKTGWKHPVWKKKTNVFLGFPVQRWHHVRFAMISIRWLLFHPKQPKGGQKRGTIKKVRWSVNFVSNYSELVAQNLIQKKLEPLFEWVPRVRLRQSDVLRTGNFVGILKNPGGQQTGWPFKSYSPICLIMPRRSKGLSVHSFEACGSNIALWRIFGSTTVFPTLNTLFE